MMASHSVASNRDDFDSAATDVSWVITDEHGLLLEASRPAAALLNLSLSALRSRQLLTFFDGEREDWRRALSAAAAGLMVDREGAMRPRERRPLRVRAEITRTRAGRADVLLWTFTEPEDRGPGPVESARTNVARPRRSSSVSHSV